MALAGATAATALIRWAWPALPAVHLVPLAVVTLTSHRLSRS
jgi:hypothetical protein